METGFYCITRLRLQTFIRIVLEDFQLYLVRRHRILNTLDFIFYIDFLPYINSFHGEEPNVSSRNPN